MGILDKIAAHAAKQANRMGCCENTQCGGVPTHNEHAHRIDITAQLVATSGNDLKMRRKHLRTLAAETLYALACVVWDINEARGPSNLQSGVPCTCTGLNPGGGFDPPHARGEYGCAYEDK